MCANLYDLRRQHELDIARRGRVVEMGTDMDWVVRLGRQEWERFTYERPASDSLCLLGSVSQGAGMGALAEDQDGNYLQINGDHVASLDSDSLRRAVAVAKGSDLAPWAPLRQEPARVPVVVIKRRRLLAPTGAKADVV
jgi:hypothetical protein